MQSTFEQIALIISQYMEISIERIQADTMFCELGCHDKEIYQIVLKLESVFSVSLDDNHYTPHYLVRELVNEVHERTQGRRLRDAQRATKSRVIRDSTQDKALRKFGHITSDHTRGNNPVLQLSDDHRVS